MTVKLTGNFLATARCLIFEDGNGITWEFDPTTNELTANASGSSTNTAANLSGGLSGDIPYQTGVGATTFLAPGSNGNLLTLSGGLPVWEAVPTWNQNTSGTAAGLSATLAIGSGGTGQTTAITAFEALSPMTTTGDIIYAPGTGTATRLGIGTSGQVLTVGGGIPGWSTPATVPTAANPTGTVGLTTVNGSATTFMRSDGAPALSQSIAPTMTGAWNFSPSSGVTGVTVTAYSASYLAFNFVGGDNSNIGRFSAPGTNGGNIVFYDTTNSVARGYIGFGASTMTSGADTDFAISAGASGVVRIVRAGAGAAAFSVAAAGSVTIAAPSSGDALTVTNVSGANALVLVGNAAGTAVLRANTQATTGAKTASMSASNKPGTNNQTTPSTWLPINLDGTTYYIPAYAA